MWRVLILALTVVLFSTASAQATVLFSEDFETGSDGWYVPGSPTAPSLTNNYNTTPGGQWSMYTYTGPSQVAHMLTYGANPNWYVTWNFFDGGANNSYLQMQVPRITTSGFLQALSLGVCGGASADYYSACIFDDLTTSWAVTSIARATNAWHSMAMSGDSTGNISFYIDGHLAAQRKTVYVYQPVVMALGSEYGSTGPGCCYDDIFYGSGAAPVPEPSGLMVLVPGLLGFFGLRRRLSK